MCEVVIAVRAERRAGVVARLWQSPTAVVARHALASYLRSGWLWGEVALVLALFGILFDFPGTGDAGYFFAMGGRTLGLESALGAAILVRRGLGPGAYLSLGKLPARLPYLRGLLIAACVLRLPLYLLLLALYVGTHGLPQPGYTIALHGAPSPSTGEELLALGFGTIGLLANCLVAAALTVALTPPVGTRLEIIAFLGWLVVALGAASTLRLPGALAALAQLPLQPIVGCSALGVNGILAWPGVLSLLADAAYVVALAVLAGRRFARRDLLLG